ncbi:MAG: SRPBCC family protein, partial [Rhodothermales bacterium]|nr:SRPBCC family protein [Rhodothermales bacterium]
MNTFKHTSTIPFDASRVFDWHFQPGAIQRLIPARDNVTVERYDGLFEGSKAVLRLQVGPISKRWVALHTDFESGVSFTDTQEKGPFKSWKHRHSVQPLGDGTSSYTDDIRYELP